MTDERGLARTIWEIGVLVRGDTAGGRLALARATSIHPTLQGLGESRLVRAAVVGAQEAHKSEQDDTPFRPALLEGVAWPDRLVWIAHVLSEDIVMAFPSDETISRRIEISPTPPPGVEAARDELDRLWQSHGRAACEAALAGATRRSRWGAAGVLLALVFLVAVISFVVHDLMQGAQRERAYREQAEMYSVPEEAIKAPLAP